MNIIAKDDIWDFIETFYPDYTHSKEIAENCDLYKLRTNEFEEGDDADKLLKRAYNNDITNPNIELDYTASTRKIYRTALDNYNNSMFRIISPWIIVRPKN